MLSEVTLEKGNFRFGDEVGAEGRLATNFETKRIQETLEEKIRSSCKGEPVEDRWISEFEGPQAFLDKNSEDLVKSGDAIGKERYTKDADGKRYLNKIDSIRAYSSEDQAFLIKTKNYTRPKKHSLENIEAKEFAKERSILVLNDRKSSKQRDKRTLETSGKEMNYGETSPDITKPNRFKESRKSVQEDRKHGKFDRRRDSERESDFSKFPEIWNSSPLETPSLIGHSDSFRADYSSESPFLEVVKDKLFQNDDLLDFEELPRSAKEKIVAKYFKEKPPRNDRFQDSSNISWEEAKSYMEIYFGKEKSLNKYSREGRLTHSQHIIRCDRFVPTIGKIDAYFHWLHKKNNNQGDMCHPSKESVYDFFKSKEKEFLRANQASKMVDTNDISKMHSIEVQTNPSGIYEAIFPSTVDAATEPIDFRAVSRELFDLRNLNRSKDEINSEHRRYREEKKIPKDYQMVKDPKRTQRTRSKSTLSRSRHNLREKQVQYFDDEPKKVRYQPNPQLSDQYDLYDEEEYMINKSPHHHDSANKKLYKAIKEKSLRFQEVEPEFDSKNYENPTFENYKHFKEKGILKKNQRYLDELHDPIEKPGGVDRTLSDDFIHFDTIRENLSKRLNKISSGHYEMPRRRSTSLRESELRIRNHTKKDTELLTKKSTSMFPPDIKKSTTKKPSRNVSMNQKKDRTNQYSHDAKQEKLKSSKKKHSDEQLSLADDSSYFTSTSSSSRSDPKLYTNKEKETTSFSNG